MIDGTRWHIALQGRDGTVTIPDLLSATLDWDISRKVVSGGKLTCANPPGGLIGGRVLVAVTYGGQRIDWGRHVVTAVDEAHTGLGSTYTVEWMDEAVRLDRMRLLSPLSIKATQQAVARVRARLADVGVVASIRDSDRTLRAAMALTATETRLDEITRLLAAAGMHPLWPSPSGLLSTLWPDPATVAPAVRLVEGEDSTHLPEYPVEADHMVPNRLLMTSQGDGQQVAMSAVARDISTTTWSYSARGDWLDAEPEESDAPSLPELQDDANRRLRELQADAVTMTVKHLWTPALRPGCTVEVVAAREAVAGLWQATASSTGDVCKTGEVATTKLRRVD